MLILIRAHSLSEFELVKVRGGDPGRAVAAVIFGAIRDGMVRTELSKTVFMQVLALRVHSEVVSKGVREISWLFAIVKAAAGFDLL